MTWYKEFSELHNEWRAGSGQKPQLGFVKVIYFCLLVFVGVIIALILKSAIDKANAQSYRTSSKYKKVIKEGIIFDTVEYHEQ